VKTLTYNYTLRSAFQLVREPSISQAHLWHAHALLARPQYYSCDQSEVFDQMSFLQHASDWQQLQVSNATPSVSSSGYKPGGRTERVMVGGLARVHLPNFRLRPSVVMVMLFPVLQRPPVPSHSFRSVCSVSSIHTRVAHHQCTIPLQSSPYPAVWSSPNLRAMPVY
jgi:hypothetical protein